MGTWKVLGIAIAIFAAAAAHAEQVFSALEREQKSFASGKIAPPDMPRASWTLPPGELGYAETTRGVLMQGIAGFLTDNQAKAVRPSEVELRRVNRGYCLRIVSNPCAQIPLETHIVNAAIAFARSGETQAFSLVSSRNDSAREALIKRQLSSRGLVSGLREGSMVHSSLTLDDTQALLEYLDLDHNQLSDYERVSAADEGYLLSKLYSGRSESLDSAFIRLTRLINSSPEVIVDRSYMISDVGSNFVLYTDSKGKLRCDGAPFKFYWAQERSVRTITIFNIEYLSPEDAANPELAERARWFYCTVAAARALAQ